MYKVFHRGSELYPYLEDLIRQAKQEVFIHIYAFHNDRIGQGILRALEEKAKSGVKVKILFDSWGSWGDQTEIVRRIRAAGGEARVYRDKRSYLFYHPISFFCRNHARLILIDGKFFGLGGMGIGEIYEMRGDLFLFFELKEESKWLREIFERFWYLGLHHGRLSHHHDIPDPLPFEPSMPILLSGPAAEDAQIYEWLLARMRSARHRIVIAATWFLPPQRLLDAISEARERGVAVSIVTPLATDREVYDGFRALPISTLLEEGVAWYGRRDYFHQKYVIVDDDWTVGSANFDILSFRRNYELNVAGTGGAMLAELEANFAGLIAGDRPRTKHPVPFIFRQLHVLSYDFVEYMFTPGVWPRRIALRDQRQ